MIVQTELALQNGAVQQQQLKKELPDQKRLLQRNQQ